MYQPKRVVKDSAASRKSLVAIALSLAVSTGTSTNDFCKVSSQVLPGGITGADMIAKEAQLVIAQRMREKEGRESDKEVQEGVDSGVAVTCVQYDCPS